MYTIRESDRTAFLKAVSEMNAAYNEEWKALDMYLAKANYHTRLACQTVHSTRDAFGYAVSLLATGEDADLKRAIEVLKHVAALQDKDPSNATYGIWSWYMEEPLSRMNPPDWNWADFCGKEILQALRHHADRLPHDLYCDLQDTLRHACLSIYRRNMGPGYTNISIMGAYVTMCGGQTLNWPWMFTYGKNRFAKFVEYSRANNTFAEYNSPTYTVVAITDLTRIHDDIDDKEVKALAEEMLDMGWKTVSDHFHAPTRQWCGPHARSYAFLTEPKTLSFLEQALGHRVQLLKNEADFVYDPAWAYVNLRCPEKYAAAFTKCVPHDVCIGFTTGPAANSPRDSLAFSHLDKDYALSSWGFCSTWNQRRNLLGFWGGEQTRFINATILHDLYDFSSGMYAACQKNGHAILVGSLLSDGGDTHCNLDMIQNETIRAYDLRARIEVGGECAAKWQLDGDIATLNDEGMRIEVRLMGASFDGTPVHLTVCETKDDLAVQNTKTDQHRRFVGDEQRSYLDVVFYSGPEKEFELSKLKSAYAAFLVSMDGVKFENVRFCTDGDCVSACADAAGDTLNVVSPLKPVSSRHWKSDSRLNGVSLKTTYHLPE